MYRLPALDAPRHIVGATTDSSAWERDGTWSARGRRADQIAVYAQELAAARDRLLVRAPATSRPRSRPERPARPARSTPTRCRRRPRAAAARDVSRLLTRASSARRPLLFAAVEAAAGAPDPGPIATPPTSPASVPESLVAAPWRSARRRARRLRRLPQIPPRVQRPLPPPQPRARRPRSPPDHRERLAAALARAPRAPQSPATPATPRLAGTSSRMGDRPALIAHLCPARGGPPGSPTARSAPATPRTAPARPTSDPALRPRGRRSARGADDRPAG